MITRLLPAAALLVLVAPALAQQAPPPAAAPGPPINPAPAVAPAPAPAPAPGATPAAAAAAPAMSKATAAEVEKRIKSLRASLAITEAELPLWTGFAQSMRENAATTEALFQRRAHAAPTMTAVDNMRSYAEIARAYADSMDRLATDFANLYNGLSEPQRKTADAMFRSQGAAQGK